MHVLTPFAGNALNKAGPIPLYKAVTPSVRI